MDSSSVAWQLSPDKELPPALRFRENRNVQLNGDPKSGTTLSETIAFLAAQTLCGHDASEASKEAGGPVCHTKGQFDQKVRKEFDLEVPERKASAHFGIGNKHTILGTHGGLECERGEPPLDPPRDPCNYDYKDDYSLAHLQKCLKRCVNPKYDGGDLSVKNGVILLVWRDVRNQIISNCFSEGSGNYNPSKKDMYRKSLPDCVKRKFARVALWARYRQLWFSSVKFPRTIVNVCYERLLKDPVHEYRKIFSALGLPASDAQIQQVVELARPTKLVHSRNPDMALKVRDAGARDYRQYGLEDHIVQWMDELHAKLSFDVDSPCGPMGR